MKRATAPVSGAAWTSSIPDNGPEGGHSLCSGGVRLFVFLFRNLAAHVIHIEGLHPADQLFQTRFREGTRLREDDDLLAEYHQRGDGSNLECGCKFLFLLGIDLRKDDIAVGLRGLLEHRRKTAARATPRGPEIDDDRVVPAEHPLKARLVRQRVQGHRVTKRGPPDASPYLDCRCGRAQPPSAIWTSL